MRVHSYLPTFMLAAAAVTMLLAGCSSVERVGPAATTPSRVTQQTAPSAAGISPGGVTTSVDAPANSTEKEYYDACHWARVWMSERGEDLHILIEPYLAMVQESDTGQPGTWNIPWVQLPPERQSAVIVAAIAAADGGCG